jgi:sec-independent protein translocase protein TatB
MFDLGWSELLLIAVVAIVVVGPHDLPRMTRTVGQYVIKIRRIVQDLQNQFNDELDKVNLDEVTKDIGELRNLNPARKFRKELTKPFRLAADELTGKVNKINQEGEAEDEKAENIAVRLHEEKPDGF